MKIVSIIISTLLFLFSLVLFFIWIFKGPLYYAGIQENSSTEIVFPERNHIAVVEYYQDHPYYELEHKIFTQMNIGRNPFYYPLYQKIIYGGTKPM